MATSTVSFDAMLVAMRSGVSGRRRECALIARKKRAFSAAVQ
jgi:hypothetical protein